VLVEEVILRYLSRSNLGDRIDLGEGIRALIRVRWEFGKMERIQERKKYFCDKGREELWHYIENCKVTVD